MFGCRRPATASASRWNRSPLVRAGVGAGEHHLQGDEAVEAQVPGPVDDAHAAAAEHRLHLVARDPRQAAPLPGAGVRRPGRARRREQRVELGLDAAASAASGRGPPAAARGRRRRPLPACARESSSSSSSCCTRGSSAMARPSGDACRTRRELQPRCISPSPAAVRRAEVAQLLRQQPQAAVQPPLHRHGRDAEHLGGLGLRQPLDAHQVEHLPLVLRQARRSPRACGGRPG